MGRLQMQLTPNWSDNYFLYVGSSQLVDLIMDLTLRIREQAHNLSILLPTH